jgi:oxygen-independent coproporphyrinogen-3 oxidase
MIPLSLYIHIPWCEKKCPYCDFNSHQANQNVDEPAYVTALLMDLQTDLKYFAQSVRNRKLQSIFIGGGTPSLFSAESVEKILQGVADQIQFCDDIEITLEANPGSAEADKFLGFKQAGVNRLSIGIQSFNHTHLTALGRAHNPNEAIKAASYAKKAGFDNFNLDLMFGLPEQTTAQSISDVRRAVALDPSHLSCYQLTIEPNTLFHHQPPITPDDEVLWEMQVNIQSLLAQAGFKQYEVSAYCLQDRQCRHNLNYWRFGDYLGIGAGAHGKLTSLDASAYRNWKIKHPTTYLERSKNGENLCGATTKIEKSQFAFEFMLNALRLTNGFKLNLFEQRTGLSVNDIRLQLDSHQQQHLIKIENQQFKLTERGKTMIDNMLQDYLPS